MLGGIYTSQACPLCGRRMIDNKKDRVCCPNRKHRNQIATELYVSFKRVFKRFDSYQAAEFFLTGLRFETMKGTYDDRDYKKSKPLAFTTLIDKYLESKEIKVDPGHFGHIKYDLQEKAGKYFGTTNVKAIDFGALEDFFDRIPESVSGKTKFNLRTNLHAFFTWCFKRKHIKEIPEFPKVDYVKGMRNTVDKLTQQRIIEEIRRISAHNPRIYIAIKWLATYVNVRPGELHDILEENVDFERGCIISRDHKTAKHIGPKIIPLLPEDVIELKTLPREFPGMKLNLFRWDASGGRRYMNKPLGKNLLGTYWRESCKNLGIAGVDLYGGTRHSTLQYLREIGVTKEDVKALSGHETSRALDHYIEQSFSIQRKGYEKTRISCYQSSNNADLQAKESNPLQDPKCSPSAVILQLQKKKTDP